MSIHGLVEEHQEIAMWEMGKWDNKANIIDRAEEMGLIGEKKDGPFVSGCSWAEPTKEKQKIEHNAVKKGKLFLVISGMDWRGVTHAEGDDALRYPDSGEWPDLQSVVKETASGFKS